MKIFNKKKKKEAFDNKKMLDLAFLGSEKSKIFQIASIVRHLLDSRFFFYQDYNNIMKINYININKKKKGVKSLTPTVSIYSLDSNNLNLINYINLSIYNNIAEDAELTLTVRDQSEKLGLFPRQLGSTPRLGASASFHSKKNIIIGGGK